MLCANRIRYKLNVDSGPSYKCARLSKGIGPNGRGAVRLLSSRRTAVRDLRRRQSGLMCKAVSSPDAQASETGEAQVTIDNSTDDQVTIVRIKGQGRPGLLATLTSTFGVLGLDVRKAEISEKRGQIDDIFWVAKDDGDKVEDGEMAAIRGALESALRAGSIQRVRPKLHVAGAPEERAELLHELMGKSWIRYSKFYK